MNYGHHLSPRDRLVLASVTLLEQASSGQLERLCFSDPDLSPLSYGVKTRLKLLKLFRQGYLRRFPSLGTGGWVYLPSESRSTRIEHHTLDVSEVYVRLMEAQRANLCEVLEWSVREQVHGKAADDAYLWIKTLSGRRDWHLEIDRGSENKPQLREKMRAYVRAYSQATSNFPPALYIVTFDPRKSLEKRRDEIMAVAKEQHEPGLFEAVVLDEAVQFLVKG